MFISQGTILSQMKISKVRPAYKSDAKDKCAYYRLISLLSSFSNDIAWSVNFHVRHSMLVLCIYQRVYLSYYFLQLVICDELSEFLGKRNILFEQQYGLKKTTLQS